MASTIPKLRPFHELRITTQPSGTLSSSPYPLQGAQAHCVCAFACFCMLVAHDWLLWPCAAGGPDRRARAWVHGQATAAGPLGVHPVSVASMESAPERRGSAIRQREGQDQGQGQERGSGVQAWAGKHPQYLLEADESTASLYRHTTMNTPNLEAKLCLVLCLDTSWKYPCIP